MKTNDISNTPKVANDRRLGQIEVVDPLKRIRSNDWPRMKNETVRIGDMIKATIVFFALGPWVLIIQNSDNTTTDPRPVDTIA